MTSGTTHTCNVKIKYVLNNGVFNALGSRVVGKSETENLKSW